MCAVMFRVSVIILNVIYECFEKNQRELLRYYLGLKRALILSKAQKWQFNNLVDYLQCHTQRSRRGSFIMSHVLLSMEIELVKISSRKVLSSISTLETLWLEPSMPLSTLLACEMLASLFRFRDTSSA